MGFFGEIPGIRDVLWACFWNALDRIGGSETRWRDAFDMLGGPWGSLGAPLELPWGPLGVSQAAAAAALGVLGGPGSGLGSSWGALGVILEVWGDP